MSVEAIREIPHIPQLRDGWRPLFPMAPNPNLDGTMFELDLMTRSILDFVSHLELVVIYQPQTPNKQTIDDFDWFVSSDLDLSSYRGKYIAVCDKQIIGVGETSLEAEQMAKAKNPTGKPALTYIPESEDFILW